MRTIFISSVLFAFLFSTGPAGALSAKVIEAVYGDELKVLMPTGQVEIVRIYGIDAPIDPQPFGKEARLYMASRTVGKEIEFQPIVRDTLNRIIAYVHIGSVSLAEDMLQKGLAWWYRKYVPWETGLAKIEDDARTMGIGLWSDPSPIPPWEFQMAPSEHAGEKTPFTIGQRGGARDRILSNVGPQRRLIGTEGSVMQRLRDRAGKESIQPGTPDIPRLEDVEKLGR